MPSHKDRALKNLFLLDPEVIFLNHGSFGATPRVVFEEYQAWQRRLERQPVLFLGREIQGLMLAARQALGEYLHAAADELVYVPNATHGVNIIARALRLEPGDEVLASDHEYGACDHAWEFICRRSGAVYKRRHVPFPVQSMEEMVEQFWAGVTGRTKLIFLSHISSTTALRFPVEQICRRARQAGILTLIDGAHAPGQIPLDLTALGADFYTGNCHKWMMAPKGAGFLYVRRERQALVEPLVVSWGWSPEGVSTGGSDHRGSDRRGSDRRGSDRRGSDRRGSDRRSIREGTLVDFLEWTGTRDPSAALSVPAAIRFMQEHNWEEVREGCQALLTQALRLASAVTGLAPVVPLDGCFYRQMAVAPLPDEVDAEALKAALIEEYRIEIPVTEWNGKKFLRISVQGYNTEEDVEALGSALEALVGSGKSRCG